MAQKVTEEEAKTKWCRHGLTTSHLNEIACTTVNRGSISSDGLCKCLGSGCMDWEWATKYTDGMGEKRLGFCDAQRGL